MEQAIEKPQPNSDPLTMCRRLYKAAWEKAFDETMFVMAEQYGVALMVTVEVEGRIEKVPNPIIEFWKESLQGLSPRQMREGLRAFMAANITDEEGNKLAFRPKPTPEDIRHYAPTDVRDMPRLKINPNCAECGGTGWRSVEVEDADYEKRHNRKRGAVVRCQCQVVAYEGKEYPVATADRQLPTPRPAEKTEDHKADVDGMIETLKHKKAISKPMTEEEKNRQIDEVKRRFGTK